MLIGFMGAGKSAVGRLLAELTGWPRYDTDEIISRQLSMPITDIFDRHGEPEFRRLEAEVIAALPEGEAIIVTGGGVVLRDENVTRLRQRGTIVSLTTDEQTLFERVSGQNTRPLLQTHDPRRTFAELLRTRAPLYAAAADFQIDTSARTPEEVAHDILSRIPAADVA